MTTFSKWRTPAREEFPVGMAELAKSIGERESVDPSWTRRFVLVEGDKWALLVDDCASDKHASGGGHLAPWAEPHLTQAFPLAYPLAEGVALLQGPDNPEAELERRRQEVKQHNEEKARESAARAEDARKQREVEEQLEADKKTFRAADWARLADWQRLCITLALKVEARDPALAADLREVVEGRLDFPRAKWWKS